MTKCTQVQDVTLKYFVWSGSNLILYSGRTGETFKANLLVKESKKFLEHIIDEKKIEGEA